MTVLEEMENKKLLTKQYKNSTRECQINERDMVTES